MPDPEVHLRPDRERRRDQAVQRRLDRTLGGVFDGNDPPLPFPPFHLVEDLRDRGRGHGGDPPAEVGEGRLVAEGGLRSQEGHGGRRLEKAGGGEDLPEDPPEGRLRKDPVVELLQVPVDHGLPGGVVDLPSGGALGLADLDRDGRPFVQEADDLPVRLLDLFPQLLHGIPLVSFILVSILPAFLSACSPGCPRSRRGPPAS